MVEEKRRVGSELAAYRVERYPGAAAGPVLQPIREDEEKAQLKCVRCGARLEEMTI